MTAQSPRLATGDATALDVPTRRALLVLCGVYYTGFAYEAWGWPAIDGYPFIERFLDPDYLARDFYTQTSPVYGVDTVQAYVFGWLQQATGLPYAVALAALNLVRCLLLPGLVYRLFVALSGSRSIAICGAVLGTLSVFGSPTTMGWSWVWGDPSTAMFAVAAILLAWSCVLTRRVWPGMVWLAAAAALHPLTAVHGLIVIGLIGLLDYSPPERIAALRSAANLASGAFVGAVFVAQYVALRSVAGEQLPIDEYVQIIARERHPGDFLPSLFPTTRRLAFALTATAAALALWRLWPRVPKRRLVVGALIAYGIICVAGYYFVERWPVRFWVDLMPYRTANIGAPFMLYVLAVFAAVQVEERRFWSFAALIGTFVLSVPLVGTLPFRYAPYLGTLAAAVQLGVVLCVVFGARVPAWAERAASTLLERRRFAVTVGALLLALGAAAAYVRREAFVLPTPENQHPIYAWARQHTAPDAVFLVDQFSSDGRYAASVNPQKLRLVARRAVVASLDFPFLDRDIKEWYRRWQEALAGRTPDRVDRADAETLLSICREFPCDYVVRRTPLPDGPRLALAARFGDHDGVTQVLVYRVTGGRVAFEEAGER